VPSADPIPGSPQQWLARARADLALARVPLPQGALLEDLCLHAQQAAEKAVKAVYQRRGWRFKYVHDIEELLTALTRHGLAIPPSVTQAAVLTDYATIGRYPGRLEPVTTQEYDEAVALAATVVAWAGTELAKPCPGTQEKESK